jgi:dolichol-phosphate mannosyltransferase
MKTSKIYLSIIVPCYNEQETVVKVLTQLDKLKLKQDYEVIVVNDGSTDNSLRNIKLFLNKNNHTKFKLLNHKQNLGKGAAIKTALKYVRGTYTIIQDADLELHIPDIIKIYNTTTRTNSQITYGSRNISNTTKVNRKVSYFYGGKILTLLYNVLYQQNLTDINTCYKLAKTSIYKSIVLKESGFAFCVEFSVKIAKKGYKIIEIPIQYSPRSHSEGKKLQLLDGLKCIFCLFRYKLS